ncbi:MAG: 30S ribosomal protein S6 [Verrucomicrobia bacterium]|nr:30S ribosomal protein S6 [Verrucomicrobiota bacterium]
MKRYEALFILNTAGKEEDATALIESLEKELKTAGAVVKTVQKMDKRTFARPTRKVSAGYYVNFVFDAPPDSIAPLRTKLALNDNVFRVMFQEGSIAGAEKKAEATAKA